MGYSHRIATFISKAFSTVFSSIIKRQSQNKSNYQDKRKAIEFWLFWKGNWKTMYLVLCSEWIWTDFNKGWWGPIRACIIGPRCKLSISADYLWNHRPWSFFLQVMTTQEESVTVERSKLKEGRNKGYNDSGVAFSCSFLRSSHRDSTRSKTICRSQILSGSYVKVFLGNYLNSFLWRTW